MNSLVADDEADEVGGVSQFRVRRPVHRSVKTAVEQERFQHGRGDLALFRVIAVVVLQHDMGFLLEVFVFLGPAERFVDFLGG